MNTATEVLGLTPQQHSEIGFYFGRNRDTRRPMPAPIQPEQYLPPVRVIAMTDRSYDSTRTELLPVFVYDASRIVFTVEQVGAGLSGYLALVIDGVRYVVECRRSHFNDLRLPGLRVTVLPGLWEFDFGQRRKVPSVEVFRITPAEDVSLCQLFDDTETVVFTGSVIVRRENWVTVPDGNETAPAVAKRDVTDCIPYQTGTVAKGAIGIAFWSWDAGYLVSAWQCRTFSHAVASYVTYDQNADPVPIGGL